MKIVLDTNVLVSGIINPVGCPGQIVDLLRSGMVQLVVDDRILSEYSDVIRRNFLSPYLGNEDCDHIMAFLRHNSAYSTSRVLVNGLPDPDDAPFLEMAITENVVLVTGNKKHFPGRLRRGCRILSPRDFLAGFDRTVSI